MAHEEIASRFQACSKAIDELGLGLVTEIDHDVAAEDHIKPADVGQGLNEIDAAIFDHIHNFWSHPVPAIPVTLAAQKVFPQPRSEYLLEPLCRICAFTCSFEGVCGNIGSEDAWSASTASFEELIRNESNGVWFLTRRTGSAPYAHGTSTLPILKNMLHKKIKVRLFSEEACVIGGEAINQLREALSCSIGL